MLRVVSIISLNRRLVWGASSVAWCHTLRPVEASADTVNLAIRNVNLRSVLFFPHGSLFLPFTFIFAFLSLSLYWCLALLPLRCPTPGAPSHQFLIFHCCYILPQLSEPILARTSPNPSCCHVHKSETCQVQEQPFRRLWSGVSLVRCSIPTRVYTDWYWLYFDFRRLRPPSCLVYLMQLSAGFHLSDHW